MASRERRRLAIIGLQHREFIGHLVARKVYSLHFQPAADPVRPTMNGTSRATIAPSLNPTISANQRTSIPCAIG